MFNPSDRGGPGSINYIEIYGESRGFQVSKKSITKKFVFVIESERFVDEAQVGSLPGTNGTMYFDDVLVQKEVMERFWSAVPMTYIFWTSDTTAIMLFAQDMDVKQLSWSKWQIDITYGIPDDNGSNTGLGVGGGDTGPSDGEQNSVRYTQVSFNGSVGTTTIQRGYLVEIQKNDLLPPAEPVPYAVNTWHPIGVSEDEISGAEVYKREFRFQITTYLPPNRMTYSFVRRLSRLMTTVNATQFFGFPPGSVMFVGYSGESDLYEVVPITLEFEVRPNFAFLQQADSIPANPNDQVINLVGGGKAIDYAADYDRIGDPEFPPTSVSTIPGQPAGVHSGWSIVSYLYLKKIETGSAAGIIREPSHRLIYVYYDLQDFNYFLL